MEVASLGVQVHGGVGYIDDAEISQVYRDARIGPIFEGSNYIQAQDLLARKVVRDDGSELRALIGDIAQAARELPPAPHALGFLRAQLLDGGSRLLELANGLMERGPGEPDLIGAAAHHFLHALGTPAGGWQWARSATAAAGPSSSHAAALIDTADFYAAHILPRMHGHEAAIRYGIRPVARALIDEI